MSLLTYVRFFKTNILIAHSRKEGKHCGVNLSVLRCRRNGYKDFRSLHICPNIQQPCFLKRHFRRRIELAGFLDEGFLTVVVGTEGRSPSISKLNNILFVTNFTGNIAISPSLIVTKPTIFHFSHVFSVPSSFQTPVAPS